MKIYNLSWSWHEDYCPHNFFHAEDKSQSDFEDDVKSLFEKYLDGYIENNEHWIGASDMFDFIATKLPELGYEKFEHIDVNAFGAYIIEDKDGDDKEFADKFLTNDHFEKILAKNKQLREEMDGRLRNQA